MVYLILITIIVLFLIQLLLAIASWNSNRSLDKKYAFALTTEIEAAKTLEHYVRIYRPVSVKVNARVRRPAVALENYILLNRNKMYLTDLFTNFYLLYQLELSKSKYNILRQVNFIHNFLFIFQIIFVVFSIVFSQMSYAFLLASLAFQLLNILISLYEASRHRSSLENAQYVASDILNLDDLEFARTESLKIELKNIGYEYPLHIIRKVVRFFLP